jgi:hypothetical protein
MGLVANAILQLLFTYAPPLQALFETEAIPLRVWPWLFVGGLVFFLVVEAEKMVISMARSGRGAEVPRQSAGSRADLGEPMGGAIVVHMVVLASSLLVARKAGVKPYGQV